MTAPTRIVRECPACEGAGEHTVNDTNRHGYGPDPQCDVDVECDACGGTGEVVLWEDPLLRLAANRRMRRLGPHWYARSREKALGGHPLAQLRMIEWAIDCDLVCRDAVAAYRRAVA